MPQLDQVVGDDLSVQQSWDPTVFGEAMDPEIADALSTFIREGKEDDAAFGALARRLEREEKYKPWITR